MTSILFKQKSKSKSIDPIVIAIYSIVPGLGQLYNGKTKKGILFLFAAFLNFLMLLASLNPASTLQFSLLILTIVRFLLGFIFKFDFEPSPACEFIMNSIKFGGSFSTLLVISIAGFVIYSMVDAYLDAEKSLQKFDYKIISIDSTMFRFSESTTSSYILHAIAFSFLFLSSLFLVIPTKPREQITEIEFILPQIESRKPPPPEVKRRSTVQSVDQGRHDPKKEITAPTMSRPLSQPLAIPKAVPKVAVQMTITPPKPQLTEEPKPIPKPQPRIQERPALTASQPAPIQNLQPKQDSAQETTRAPAPEAPSSQPAQAGSNTGIAILPKVPTLPGTGGLGNAGNPAPNERSNEPPSIAARKDIDFGPYMNELQRRIKNAWRPPRGNESKRVIVNFRINTLGELTDLKIKVSSGAQVADQAALVAVQNAAPFNRLPSGAPGKVDIEFTFDYNVFGAKGSYRQY